MSRKIPTLDSIYKRYQRIERLVGLSSRDVRDADLEPHDNIKRLGQILSILCDLEHSVFVRRPDLVPLFLRGTRTYPSKNPPPYPPDDEARDPDEPRDDDWQWTAWLENMLLMGEQVPGDRQTRFLIRRAARSVGLGIVEVDSLDDPSTRESLVKAITERVSKGSRRMGKVLYEQVPVLLELGMDTDARRLIERYLADEPVPLYRNIAQDELHRLVTSSSKPLI